MGNYLANYWHYGYCRLFIMTNILRIPYSLFRPIYERTSFHKSVIEDVSDEELKEAYRHCREITRRYAKTFYMATRFLPNEKQRGIFAIYGMCRYLDNLVDECEDLVSQRELSLDDVDARLNAFRDSLKRVYEGETVSDPILLAFSDTLKIYKISFELPCLLIEGVRQDLVKSRYKNFQEVYDYSYKVASVVGLMTSEVFGYEGESALRYATDLGIAMQLTNILRDVGEDLRRGRIYLPETDMKMFNVSESQLYNGDIDENFRDLMRYQIRRARAYYQSADRGIVMLSKDSRLPVYLARHNYSRILDKIEENEYNVLDQRAYLNQSEKLSIIPKVLFEMRAAS